MVKLPTGNKDDGVSTGKADFLVDFIVSKEARTSRSSSPATAASIVPRQPDGFDAAERRVPLGRRRRLPVAQSAAR